MSGRHRWLSWPSHGTTSCTCARLTRSKLIASRACFPPRATCDPPSGGPITNSSNTTQLLRRTGVLSADAYCTIRDTDDMVGHSAGDTIDYNIDLTNTGTTTLTMITVSADMLPQERYGHQGTQRLAVVSLTALSTTLHV